MEALKLSDFIPFCKYKDLQIVEIIYYDPQYMAWLYEQDSELFAEDVTQLMEKRKLI